MSVSDYFTCKITSKTQCWKIDCLMMKLPVLVLRNLYITIFTFNLSNGYQTPGVLCVIDYMRHINYILS